MSYLYFTHDAFRSLFHSKGYSWTFSHHAYTSGGGSGSRSGNGKGGFWEYFMYILQKGKRSCDEDYQDNQYYPENAGTNESLMPNHAHMDDENFLNNMLL